MTPAPTQQNYPPPTKIKISDTPPPSPQQKLFWNIYPGYKFVVILHKFDVNCISETYLDKSAENDAISIDGYNIIWADHPHNKNREGVCIILKSSWN